MIAAFDTLDAAFDDVAPRGFDALTTPELLRLLERLERVRRRQPAVEHGIINQLRQLAVPAELGGTLAHASADRLRITRAEANRRIREAQDLGGRRTLTGEPLAPRLEQTAAGQISVIRRFSDQLPCWVDVETRQQAEKHLAKLAASGITAPYADKPVLDGTPSQDAIDRDTRSPAQRNHDGLDAA